MPEALTNTTSSLSCLSRGVDGQGLTSAWIATPRRSRSLVFVVVLFLIFRFMIIGLPPGLQAAFEGI